MKNKVKVSVLLPSLNVVNYIEECLLSVLNQSLQEIEILCIDAGSNDGTLEIIKNYAQDDSRIKLINSAKKSYGYQLNLGIKIAQGEYIGIVETDDYIEKDMFLILYDEAKNNSAEVVKSDFKVFTTLNNGERIYLDYYLKTRHKIEYNRIYTRDDYLENDSVIDTFVWNGIYSKSFLKKYRIKFNETPGAAFQDCGFRYQVAINLNRGYFLEESFYRYRRDNITSSTYSKNSPIFNYQEIKFIRNKARKYDDSVKKYLCREMITIAILPYIELLMYQNPNKDVYRAYAQLKKYYIEAKDHQLTEENALRYEVQLALELMEINSRAFLDFLKVLSDREKKICTDFFTRIKNSKDVVLFGTGERGKGLACLFLVNGLNKKIRFCDNSTAMQGTKLFDLEVDSVENAAAKNEEATYVISNYSHKDEMKQQLLDLGVKEENIVEYFYRADPLFCTNKLSDW